MVAAYHLIWTAYGWWLANDPRGSSSHEIRQLILKELGELHYGRKKIQPSGKEIRAFYDKACLLLKHELRTFTDEEIALIAASIEHTIIKKRYTCYACAIMPDHVHMVIRKHKDKAEDMIAAFQDLSREALIEAKVRSSDHPVWGGPGWKVYLETAEDIRRTIGYVRDNPEKINKPVQEWGFVREYDGWLPGGGGRAKG